MASRDRAAIIDAMMRNRQMGQGPDSVAPHNPNWPPYQMYPEIYDDMEDGDYDAYNMMEEPPRLHIFGRFAQYGGQPLSPDAPSAADLRRFDRTGDFRMRQAFEDRFGIQARERAERGLESKDPSYVPTPRPRPSSAPLNLGDDDYAGDQSGMNPESFPTEGQPIPEEVYGYMPGLRERVLEHLRGPGPARDLRGDRGDGTRFDRAMAPFEGQETGNIQDLRAMAIEQMLRRGGEAKAQTDEEDSRPMSQEGETLDEMMQRHLREMGR